MEVVKGLLNSKKFITTMIGMIVSIAVTLGLDPAVAAPIVAIAVKCTVGFVLGQGMADLGKEKAKVEAAGAATVTAAAPAAELTPG